MTINTVAMANCRHLLLTAAAASSVHAGDSAGDDNNSVEVGRTFRCKTCDRKFSSFQALGGHRASHKKTKPPSELSVEFSGEVLPPPVKTKVHICPICGQDFPIGQALGGHMRRHRSVVGNSTVSGSTVTVENSNSVSDDGNCNKRSYVEIGKSNVGEVPVEKKRICVDLDLDLRLCSWNYDDVKYDVRNGDVGKIEEGGIVEPDHDQVIAKEEKERDFLKLELWPPINFDISYN